MVRYPPLVLSFTQAHLCDTPFCNVSRDNCAIPHKNKHERVLRYYRYKYRYWASKVFTCMISKKLSILTAIWAHPKHLLRLFFASKVTLYMGKMGSICHFVRACLLAYRDTALKASFLPAFGAHKKRRGNDTFRAVFPSIWVS